MNQLKLSINYGSIAGMLSFVAFLVFFYLGFQPLGGISWLSAWIVVALIVISIKHQREGELEGYITYKQALRLGMFISFFYASMFAMLVYIFGLVIDASFLSMNIEETLADLEKSWETYTALVDLETSNSILTSFFSEANYNLMFEKIESMTLGELVMDDFWDKMFGGFFASLIIAAMYKKTPEINL